MSKKAFALSKQSLSESLSVQGHRPSPTQKAPQGLTLGHSANQQIPSPGAVQRANEKGLEAAGDGEKQYESQTTREMR